MKLKFSAVEQYGDAVVFEGAEAAGAGLDHLDLRVKALGHGVGDAVGDVVEQAWEMILQHHRDLGDRSQRGILGLLQPLVEECEIGRAHV